MEPRKAKIALLVIIIGAVVWLGGVNVRVIIAADLLEFGRIEFRSNIHPIVERAIFSVIAKSSLVVIPAYLVTLAATIVFLRTTGLVLRQNGWLMMSTILFYIFVPVEAYTMILDLKIFALDFTGSNDLVEYRKLFIHRLGALSGVPIITLFCYYTIIGLVVFQPMKKREISGTY